MTVHLLKTLPQYFDAVVDGRKTFEVRLNDRDFKVGDYVTLVKLLVVGDEALETNSITTRRITYILHGGMYGVDPQYCVLGLRCEEVQQMKFSYEKSKSDYLYLESLAPIGDMVEVMSELDSLLVDPTKKRAANMYESMIWCWHQAYLKPDSDDRRDRNEIPFSNIRLRKILEERDLVVLEVQP